ncbi:hypothetical protein ACWGRF_28785 [Streptomyces zhihengii]
MGLVAGLVIGVTLAAYGIALTVNLEGARDFWARSGEPGNAGDRSFHVILIGMGCFLAAMGLYMAIGSLITEL